MRITEELLVATVKPASGQTAAQALSKASHIRLNSKQIEKIEGLDKCVGLQVLYLYDNRITVIENLDFATSLTHLYLQGNRIQGLGNLSALRSLTKLYVDGNAIAHLTGLHTLRNLQELHISKQQLPPDTHFTIDEATTQALANSLVVLSITDNRLVDITPLRHLASLQKLDASGNLLRDVDAIKIVLQSCRSIRDANFSSNPVASTPKYSQQVIVSSRSLETLDGKDIPAQHRQAMMALEAKRQSTK